MAVVPIAGDVAWPTDNAHKGLGYKENLDESEDGPGRQFQNVWGSSAWCGLTPLRGSGRHGPSLRVGVLRERLHGPSNKKSAGRLMAEPPGLSLEAKASNP